jgi:hypothetical protein
MPYPLLIWLRNLRSITIRIDFPVLELKFNSNYYTYNCLPWHIPNRNWVVLYGYITQLMLRYHQLIVEEVPDTSKPIYTANKAEILEDWTTALPLRI